MPPVEIQNEESSAFTVLNNDNQDEQGILPVLPSNVNVVKPLQLEDGRPHAPSAKKGADKQPEPIPQTILDPKFSRALDFKLRRLKEKEILQANIRRPPRRRYPRSFAVSQSNISSMETSQRKTMSQSHPRINGIGLGGEKSKISPKMDKSPSPGRRSRSRPHVDGEKPRFVTTVKTGEFLLPPPELACLLGLENLYPEDKKELVYSYSSKPKVVPTRGKRAVVDKKENKSDKEIRQHAGDVFLGVRQLVAGVIGMKNFSEAHNNGSMTQFSNMMHERRVVRGSTYAAHPLSQGDGIESQAARVARTRRRALARRAAAARLRPGTPPPAPGRKHHPIQTEYYLEELFDKGVEMEVGVQTDLFVDRPSTPIYVPAKTGMDAATQIYPGDLFDFDLEVQPILEVLVGKTTEQALAEVAQEEELATLREQQRRYMEMRDAERAERERLSAQDLRLFQEKELRVAEARTAQINATEARERVAAAVLVQGYLAELLPSVLAGLREQGYLMERIERGVDDEFVPWLVQAVSEEIESIITSRDVITEIVRDVVEARAELYRSAGEAEFERQEPEESITPPSVPYGEGEEDAFLEE